VAYPLLNAASHDDGEILPADACRPCAGHVLGFMSIGIVVTKIMTFFQKCVQVGLHFCSCVLRSVGGSVGSRLIPAGWLADSSSPLGRSGPTVRNSVSRVQVTGAGGAQKPSVWIDAGVHAREWISHATALYFIDRVQVLDERLE